MIGYWRERLHLVNSDLCGPICNPKVGKETIFVTLYNGASSVSAVRCIQTKDKNICALRNLIVEVY